MDAARVAGHQLVRRRVRVAAYHHVMGGVGMTAPARP
jgi:hypothetical protein